MMYVRYKQECGTGKGGIRIGAYDGYMMANKEQTQKNGERKQKKTRKTQKQVSFGLVGLGLCQGRTMVNGFGWSCCPFYSKWVGYWKGLCWFSVFIL